MITDKPFASFLLFTIVFFIITEQALSQAMLPGSDNSDSKIQYSLMPVAGYTSDIGLFGGALFQRINYGEEGRNPFLSIIKANVIGSFRGEFEGEVEYESTALFKQDLRSSLSLELFKSDISHFFGLGNQSGFSEELYDEKYYYFRQQYASLNWRIRRTVAEFGFKGELDFFAELQSGYHKTASLDENSRFAEYRTRGDNFSGWTNLAGIGFIADDRNSEFNTTEGYRYEAGLSLSNPLFASEYNFLKFWGELRNYVEIIPNVVIAHKLRGELITGDAPFWEMSSLGNSVGLRGYPLDRFRGERSILNIFEARTWLFSILEGEIRFGGQLFWDSGRVFSTNDSPGLFDDWKHTYGAGGAISLFNPDFIVRGDLGFSEDTFRIYAGIGYIF